MKVRYTRPALRDLDQVRAYIALDNPLASRAIGARIGEAIASLSDFPERGRPGRVAGTRELVVTGTPYVVPYRIKSDEVTILAIMHGARRWPRSGF